jgi:hypothetical protein
MGEAQVAGTDIAFRDDLEAILDALEEASFRLPLGGQVTNERARRELAVGIRRSLQPRADDPEEPVVGLVTGLTGTGKSTIVNSLAQRRLSEASAIRPTTTAPVIWAHRRHGGRYWQGFVAKVEETIGPSAQIILDGHDMLEHMTLIDSPPLDGGGAELLGLADLAVFVTSATRYGDAETWELLETLRARGLPILVVLNRVPRDAGSSQAVVNDFAAKLADAGFLPEPDPALLFVVFEHRVDISTDGLPASAVSGLTKDLLEIGDPAFRQRLIATADAALLRDLGRRGVELADAARREASYGRQLLAVVEQAYNARLASIDSDLQHGRFNDLADDWDPGAMAGRLARQMGSGAQDSAAAWSEDPVARRLLTGGGSGLWQPAETAVDGALDGVRRWLITLEQLAADRSARRWLLRTTRRRLGALLRRASLAGSGNPVPAQLVKRYGDRGAVALVRASRSALVDAAGVAFQEDASRFRAAVGPIERLEVLAALLEEKASALEGRAR